MVYRSNIGRPLEHLYYTRRTLSSARLDSRSLSRQPCRARPSERIGCGRVHVCGRGCRGLSASVCWCDNTAGDASLVHASVCTCRWQHQRREWAPSITARPALQHRMPQMDSSCTPALTSVQQHTATERSDSAESTRIVRPRDAPLHFCRLHCKTLKQRSTAQAAGIGGAYSCSLRHTKARRVGSQCDAVGHGGASKTKKQDRLLCTCTRGASMH